MRSCADSPFLSNGSNSEEKFMDTKQAIAALEKAVPEPALGLPDDVFFYISRVTPMINVDLLVKDKAGRTLLAWRHEQYWGRGWHLPGGIVRFRETLETRIRKVAGTEIGSSVDFEPVPLAVNQLINHQRRTRGHFISLLYSCRLPAGFTPENKGLAVTDAGYLRWYEACPDDLFKTQEIYRKFI